MSLYLGSSQKIPSLLLTKGSTTAHQEELRSSTRCHACPSPKAPSQGGEPVGSMLSCNPPSAILMLNSLRYQCAGLRGHQQSASTAGFQTLRGPRPGLHGQTLTSMWRAHVSVILKLSVHQSLFTTLPPTPETFFSPEPLLTLKRNMLKVVSRYHL